ncbi:MAG: toprim domain-containing protein [Thermoplasmata archaeon]
MRIRERLEGVVEILGIIREKNEDYNIPIIVEGKNDVEALRQLNFSGKVIRIKKRRSVFHIIESLRGDYDEVIVMTDWDKTGGRLAYRIKKACEANEIKCYMDYRREIIKYVKKDIKDVEGLPKFIRRMKAEVPGERPRDITFD